METLVEQYSNSLSKLIYDHHSFQVQNHVNNNPYQPTQPPESEESILTDSCGPCLGSMADISSSEMMEMSQKPDSYQGVLNYIDQVLMEEDVLRNPCMFHQCSALQAAEKSFYDLLGQTYPPPPPPPCQSSGSEGSSANNEPTYEDVNRCPYFTNLSFESIENESVNSVDLTDKQVDGLLVRPFTSNDCNLDHRLDLSDGYLKLPKEESDLSEEVIQSHLLKKIHCREEDSDNTNAEQSRKQSATCVNHDDDDDEVLFCEELLCSKLSSKKSKDAKARKAAANREESTKAFVDLNGLLTRCAKAVQSSDVRNAGEILKRIREHSSPKGDSSERMAHYFANAIEARLGGTGIGLYTSFNRKRIAAADILKGYQAYVKACPFHRMSNLMANKSIIRVVQEGVGVTRLHIIDFGILYGFQWPCLIQAISMRSGGPPTLRITGIDFPQPGFRPAERVEATGNHLARYCKKFNVPFEYNAIAKNWDSIQLEDLRIEKDETLVVNCMYRLKNVPDETLDDTSPRDVVLDLIKKINPHLFVHGVLNGTFNVPFFITRFREAMFHFSSLFDMFEATKLRDDKHRLLFEQEVFGRDAMNVIACEGSARIERPETYKQWQFRNMKAGFKQLPLHQDFVKEISAKVKFGYHREFLLDEEKNWMLQGWKGRVLYALSLWKPAGK